MFGKSKLQKEIENYSDERMFLKKSIATLKEEIAELKTTKIMEEREIKHLVKMKEEKLDIEYKKKELELKDSFKDKEMKLQTSYHDKSISQIEVARTEMKEVYTAIMERLPNVNMEINRGRK